MAENTGLVEDVDDPGEFPDWMEIYNPAASPIALDGLFLTDSLRETTMYAIPNGLSVPAKGFIIFWLDDDAEQGPTHTNFSLNKDGDFLALPVARLPHGGQGQQVVREQELHAYGACAGCARAVVET